MKITRRVYRCPKLKTVFSEQIPNEEQESLLMSKQIHLQLRFETRFEKTCLIFGAVPPEFCKCWEGEHNTEFVCVIATAYQREE